MNKNLEYIKKEIYDIIKAIKDGESDAIILDSYENYSKSMLEFIKTKDKQWFIFFFGMIDCDIKKGATCETLKHEYANDQKSGKQLLVHIIDSIFNKEEINVEIELDEDEDEDDEDEDDEDDENHDFYENHENNLLELYENSNIFAVERGTSDRPILTVTDIGPGEDMCAAKILFRGYGEALYRVLSNRSKVWTHTTFYIYDDKGKDNVKCRLMCDV